MISNIDKDKYNQEKEREEKCYKYYVTKIQNKKHSGLGACSKPLVFNIKFKMHFIDESRININFISFFT